MERLSFLSFLSWVYCLSSLAIWMNIFRRTQTWDHAIERNTNNIKTKIFFSIFLFRGIFSAYELCWEKHWTICSETVILKYLLTLSFPGPLELILGTRGILKNKFRGFSVSKKVQHIIHQIKALMLLYNWRPFIDGLGS